MAVANAPMPLASQIAANATITVSIPLRGIGPFPGFADGGTTFNSGSPTMTLTIPTGPSGTIGSNDWQNLIDEAERIWREGTGSVS